MSLWRFLDRQFVQICFVSDLSSKDFLKNTFPSDFLEEIRFKRIQIQTNPVSESDSDTFMEKKGTSVSEFVCI